MSLDGFIAGPNERPDNGLGDGSTWASGRSVGFRRPCAAGQDREAPRAVLPALLTRVAAVVGPPEHVVRTLAEAAARLDVHGYAPFSGLPELKQAIASRYARL